MTLEFNISLVTNVVADALSRVDITAGYFSLSMSHFIFLDELRQCLTDCQDFIDLLSNVLQLSTAHSDYKIHQDLIYFKGKIWLPSNCSFKQRLLQEFHNTPIAGHQGRLKTFMRLQDNFFWQGMRKDVNEFIAQCGVCQ